MKLQKDIYQGAQPRSGSEIFDARDCTAKKSEAIVKDRSEENVQIAKIAEKDQKSSKFSRIGNYEAYEEAIAEF